MCVYIYIDIEYIQTLLDTMLDAVNWFDSTKDQ